MTAVKRAQLGAPGPGAQQSRAVLGPTSVIRDQRVWMSETEEALVQIPGLPSLALETMALRSLGSVEVDKGEKKVP